MTKLLTGFRWFILLLILVISFLLMLNAARSDSAIRGEFILDLKNLLWLRIISIAFALILSLSIYLWSKELIGRWWALLPTFLFAFSPSILTYGHYFSADIFAAFGIFASIFTFLNFLLRPSRSNLFFAVLAFGTAQFLKFSSVILVPIFLVLITIFYISSVIRDWAVTEPSARSKRFRVRAIRYFRSVFIILFVGFLILYGIFAFQEKSLTKPIFDYLTNLSGYLKLSGGGWQFLTLFLVKEPLPSLILITFSLIFFLWNTLKLVFEAVFRKLKFSDYLGTHFPEFSLIIFIISYGLLNFFVEPLAAANYLILAPFIYVLSASAIKSWFSIPDFNLVRNLWLQIAVAATNIWQLTLKSASLAIILVSYLFAILITSPSFLSYFNSFDLIFKYSPKYSVQFDYDRGQDIGRLANWIEKESADKIAVDVLASFNIKNYFGGKAVIWESGLGNPKEKDIDWMAASLIKRNEYRWLQKMPVYARIGGTIYIYKL